MPTLILVRHGRSTSNTSGVLAGRTAGVELDDKGRGQAEQLVERLAPVPIAAIVTSPLTRCAQTVEPLAKARGLDPSVEPDLTEVDYGEWTGRELKDLAKEDLWRVVQAHPSAAVFPGGEGLAQMQCRAVAAIRRWDRRIAEEHGPNAVWVACSHGDPIKSVVADAMATHLDNFQRIVVDNCSLSVITYTPTRPFVARVNDVGGDVAALIPKKDEKPAEEAVVGGSTGA
ncbi:MULTISPECIES: histidine phosphatase family protein [Pseudonocardia]|uniref:Probable phosphomutase, MSMEG_4193 family n=1 Tax=Pseudonocardia oroxyli TaxID=366584 RepID=A0A1G7VV33_PSEOR|nr:MULTISPECIES: histidine phosphatase family protein [Pseudonocardia]MCF7553470.1 MSMEG_4193 family putative phosphomutase [Pseudonocardia sp. WMMC193]SDG63654.1 probable phosphomutase, MSMEG_4193 family [Pseudonocardia oroxyli]